MFQLRQRSQLKYQISPKQWKERYEIIVYYSSEDGVHMDFIKYGAKKTCLISLNEEQIRTWQFVRSMLSTAVKKKETFQYDLGGDVKAEHSKFRKVFYVTLRQWFPDDAGDFQAGKYGINIPHEVWSHYTSGETAMIIGKEYHNHVIQSYIQTSVSLLIRLFLILQNVVKCCVKTVMVSITFRHLMDVMRTKMNTEHISIYLTHL